MGQEKHNIDEEPHMYTDMIESDFNESQASAVKQIDDPETVRTSQVTEHLAEPTLETNILKRVHLTEEKTPVAQRIRRRARIEALRNKRKTPAPTSVVRKVDTANTDELYMYICINKDQAFEK